MGKLYLKLRYPVALLSVFGGYGFASADNLLPGFVCAAVCALIGLACAYGPDAYYKWLNHVRDAQDDALNGIEPDGHYTGDGVPRDASGHEYEPLDWPEGLVRI